MQVHHRLAKWLTRGYARTIDLSGVSREEIYQAHDEERKVFWIDAENWSAAGQCTPFGTILLNEDRLNEVPANVRDYVFLHEVGYAKLPSILSLASIIVRVPLVLLAAFSVPVLIGRLVTFALSIPNLGQLVTFAMATLTTILLIVIPVIAIWWLDEGYAELFTVSKIGVNAYQRRHEKMNEHSDRGIVGRFLRLLLYPNPELIVWIAKQLDR